MECAGAGGGRWVKASALPSPFASLQLPLLSPASGQAASCLVCRLPAGGGMPAGLEGGEPITFEEPAYELRCGGFLRTPSHVLAWG